MVQYFILGELDTKYKLHKYIKFVSLGLLGTKMKKVELGCHNLVYFQESGACLKTGGSPTGF